MLPKAWQFSRLSQEIKSLQFRQDLRRLPQIKIRSSNGGLKTPSITLVLQPGQASGGLVVIDMDIDKDKGKDGYETLKEWQREHEELPETWTSITGRGGYHFFYRSKDPEQSHVDLYEAVDIRADGGYIVAPPSIHPNGNKYEWEYSPECPLAEVNDTVKAFLHPKKEQKKEPLEMAETIQEGKRVESLVRLSGSLQAKGLGKDAVIAALKAENETKCNPPLSDKELEREVFPSLKRGWKPERAYAVPDAGGFRIQKFFRPVTSINAIDLLKMDIPPIEWLIEEIMPIGLGILGAPSKYYKSYMALDICIKICKGGKFLGFNCPIDIRIDLDLESTERRPRDRLKQILNGEEAPDNLHIITGKESPGRLGEGLEEQIAYQLETFSDIKLIVIDVFQLIRKPAKRSQSGYDRDYEDIKALKNIIAKYNVGILLIHHTRKMKDPSDVFNELSGSVGIMGGVDFAWVITKDNRDSKDAALNITGRDLESRNLKIQFNTSIYQWEYIGTVEEVERQKEVDEYHNSNITKTIKSLLKSNQGQWEGDSSDIKKASAYVGHSIYEDVRVIGKFIKKNKHLFFFDGIEFEYKKGTAGKRRYNFHATNADNDIYATNADNAEQMNLNNI